MGRAVASNRGAKAKTLQFRNSSSGETNARRGSSTYSHVVLSYGSYWLNATIVPVRASYAALVYRRRGATPVQGGTGAHEIPSHSQSSCTTPPPSRTQRPRTGSKTMDAPPRAAGPVEALFVQEMPSYSQVSSLDSPPYTTSRPWTSSNAAAWRVRAGPEARRVQDWPSHAHSSRLTWLYCAPPKSSSSRRTES